MGVEDPDAARVRQGHDLDGGDARAVDADGSVEGHADGLGPDLAERRAGAGQGSEADGAEHGGDAAGVADAHGEAGRGRAGVGGDAQLDGVARAQVGGGEGDLGAAFGAGSSPADVPGLGAGEVAGPEGQPVGEAGEVGARRAVGAGGRAAAAGDAVADAAVDAEAPGEGAGVGFEQHGAVGAEGVGEHGGPTGRPGAHGGAVEQGGGVGVAFGGDGGERCDVGGADGLLLAGGEAVAGLGVTGAAAAQELGVVDRRGDGGARRPFGVEEVVVGAEDHHGRAQRSVAVGEVAAGVDGGLALEVADVAVAVGQQDGAGDAGCGLAAEGGGGDVGEADDAPAGPAAGVDGGAFGAFAAAAVPDEHDAVHVEGAVEAAADGVVAGRFQRARSPRWWRMSAERAAAPASPRKSCALMALALMETVT